MNNTRQTRTMETRELEQRPYVWRPANTLPDPDPQPGFEFRWVRTAFMNRPDPNNVNAKMREGWVPCTVEDQPRLAQMLALGAKNQTSTGNIEMGDLMLCKIPVEIARARDNYYQNATQAQTDSVNLNVMRENDARMPMFSERSSKVSFGRGG